MAELDEVSRARAKKNLADMGIDLNGDIHEQFTAMAMRGKLIKQNKEIASRDSFNWSWVVLGFYAAANIFAYGYLAYKQFIE